MMGQHHGKGDVSVWHVGGGKRSAMGAPARASGASEVNARGFAMIFS